MNEQAVRQRVAEACKVSHDANAMIGRAWGAVDRELLAAYEAGMTITALATIVGESRRITTRRIQLARIARYARASRVVRCSKMDCGKAATHVLKLRRADARGQWEQHPRCDDHPPELDLRLIRRVMPWANVEHEIEAVAEAAR
jgi:hypothetical protein